MPAPLLLPQEAKYFKIPEYSSGIGPEQTNSGYATFFDQDHIGVPHEADLRLTVAQKQKFAICEICPDWGYANEATKVWLLEIHLFPVSVEDLLCSFYFDGNRFLRMDLLIGLVNLLPLFSFFIFLFLEKNSLYSLTLDDFLQSSLSLSLARSLV